VERAFVYDDDRERRGEDRRGREGNKKRRNRAFLSPRQRPFVFVEREREGKACFFALASSQEEEEEPAHGDDVVREDPRNADGGRRGEAGSPFSRDLQRDTTRKRGELALKSPPFFRLRFLPRRSVGPSAPPP